MALQVTVSVVSGNKVLDYEVSGGAEGYLSAGSKSFSIGKQGNIISFLTIRRNYSGKASIKVNSGTALIAIDGKSDKKVRSGSSITLTDSNKRAVIREKP